MGNGGGDRGGGGISRGVNVEGATFGIGGGIFSDCCTELPGRCVKGVTEDGTKGKGVDGLIRKLLPDIMRGETRLKGGFGVVFSHGLPGPGYTGRTKEVWIGGGGGGITAARCAETGGQGGIPCGTLLDSNSL